MMIEFCCLKLGYPAALAQFTLKKFFLLVLFLDKAKCSRLIDYDPCLFCKDSEYKVVFTMIHGLLTLMFLIYLYNAAIIFLI